jgi:predicted lipoprotein with Yx(FWY)xxD motif
MQLRPKSILAFASFCLLAVALAACGGSSNSSDATSTTASAPAGGDTVSTKSIGGVGDVLFDSKGNALYTNDMDSGSKVACTGECTAIWVPVAAPSAGQPTSNDSSVQAKLGTVMRPDGTSQITFGGKPLYSFVQDSPGKVTGNGFSDSFGGTSFTWTAATAGGTPPPSSGNTTTAGSAGGGYGGGGGGY